MENADDSDESDTDSDSDGANHGSFLMLEAPDWDLLCHLVRPVLIVDVVDNRRFSPRPEVFQISVPAIDKDLWRLQCYWLEVGARLHRLIPVVDWPFDCENVCLRHLLGITLRGHEILDVGVVFTIL